jgi:hypothetical protein
MAAKTALPGGRPRRFAFGSSMLKRVVAVSTVVVAVSLSAAPPPVAAAPSVPCRGRVSRHLRNNAMDIVQLRTFTVEIKPLAKTYKIGKPAQVAVVVTRPAHRDPLQLGPEFEPPTSAPAADVSVGVGIHVGEAFVPGFGVTDENGKTTVTIKLPSYMKPGFADLDGYAWKIQFDSPCMTIEEDGYTHMDKAFAVER